MKSTEIFKKDLFKGRVVFVTGGGSGINLGVARNFTALGADVAICGRKIEKLQAAKAELETFGGRVVAEVADVRDFAALEAAFNVTREKLGPIHTLVCGAAGNFICPAENLSPNGFKTVIDIDLLGSFNASRACFAQLKESKGNIIFISAGQSYLPYFGQAHVGAAKAGIDNLMKNLALEWGRHGIRANSIVPGPIENTEGMKRLAPGGVDDKLSRAIPLGKYGTVDDIAQMALYLASPLASYVTGTVTVVDGGQNLLGSGLWAHIIMEQMAAAGAPKAG